MMRRHTFQSGRIQLSYLDSEVKAPLIVALHALWMQGSSFQALSARLFPKYRMVALDQRGHGKSEKSNDYSREAFVEDIRALLEHLQVTEPVVLLGNSLGATNAYQFAARYPEKVSLLINEEGPAWENYELDWIKSWGGSFASPAEFAERVGRLYWSVKDSLGETSEGYRLEFEPEDMLHIQRLTNGDWWSDWLATSMPAMVICGSTSRAVDSKLMQEMANRRKNTRFVLLDAGHVMHEDNVAATARVIGDFLAEYEHIA